MPRALIIGASRGIGHELARQYRTDGWDVIGTARDEAGLGKLAALGAKALKLDATDASAASTLEAGIAGVGLDVVVFCAGIYGPRTQGIDPPSESEFDAVMRTNVLAAMNLAPVTVPALAGCTARARPRSIRSSRTCRSYSARKG